MCLAIVTHSRSIYRTTQLTTHLERLEVPHVVVIPADTALMYRDGEPCFYQRGKRFWPTLALNALYQGSGEGLEYVESLEAAGVLVINRASPWRRAKSKPLSTAYLCRAGIPQPETYIGYRGRSITRSLPKSGKLFVSKPWKGSLGKGITRGSLKHYRRRLKRKGYRSRKAYLQRFVRNPGRDIRVVVVGGRAVGATYRVAPDGEWKTNVAAGGTPVYCPVYRELASVAVRATRALELDIAGVDIIESSEGYIVVELNAWPEYEVFDRIARVDVAKMMAYYLAARYRRISLGS